MWDWLSNVGGWFKSGENLKGAGSVVSGLGQAYGSLSQDKLAREMLKTDKELNDEERKRRARTQLSLDSAFSNLDTSVPKLNLGA